MITSNKMGRKEEEEGNEKKQASAIKTKEQKDRIHCNMLCVLNISTEPAKYGRTSSEYKLP